MDVVEQLKYLDVAFDSKLYVKKKKKTHSTQHTTRSSVQSQQECRTVVNFVTYSNEKTVKSIDSPSEGFELS